MLRIAETFFRFGSFEIFKKTDPFTGRSVSYTVRSISITKGGKEREGGREECLMNIDH